MWQGKISKDDPYRISILDSTGGSSANGNTATTNLAKGEAWVRAIEAGADFYFTKPGHHQELVARVKAILRRYKEAPE